ncbi:hypothetical protein EHS25_008458 [Saitozyma podzolica]|uniref:Hyaluronan/mRNA-binding protein domain-containing protein n=1 Tax=Saitozyma podzolica TaxID=1890683 RepID=A0A427YPM9_9TREE|nr:hypothetical protein EHS25_008458 [Saitozyma podzolica]
MSVVSKNPFDLLGDDGEESTSPAQVAKAAAPKKTEAAPAARAVPGSAPKPAAAAPARGGRYPSRGAPRNVYREGEPRNAGPTSAEGVTEGFETPGGFDGERVHNARRGAHVRDAHTKGPRGNRPARNPTSGGHTSTGSGNARRPRVPVDGGERRHFERKSGPLPDSQKKVDAGWGPNEGTAELSAEVEGEKDAVAEENAPQTPAAEGEEPVAAEAAADVAEEEPEEVQKSLDQYLAERAAAALAVGKKEARQVSADTLEGQAFRREAIDEFFSGKEKAATKATKAPRRRRSTSRSTVSSLLPPAAAPVADPPVELASAAAVVEVDPAVDPVAAPALVAVSAFPALGA